MPVGLFFTLNMASKCPKNGLTATPGVAWKKVYGEKMQIINHHRILGFIPFLFIGSCVMTSSVSYGESITSKQSRSEIQNVLGRQLDELIADFIDDGKLQGAVIAVKKNDKSI